MKSILSKFEMSRMAFVAIMLVSFVTTGIGLSTTLSGVANIWMLYSAAFAASAVVQLMIGVAWTRFGKSLISTKVSVVVFFLLGMAISIVSGVFASSANMWLYQSNFVLEREHALNRKSVLKPVVDVVSRTNALFESFADYSKFSEQRSKREESHGDSCEGKKLANTCGSICQLRNEQSKDAQKMASITEGLKREAIDLQSNSGGASDQASINKLYKQAILLTESNKLRTIKTWVNKEISGFQGSFEFNDKQIICKDSEALAKLTSIKKVLQEKTTYDNSPPTVSDPSVSDVAAQNVTTLRKLLVAALDAETAITDEDRVNINDHIVVWLWSLFIEITCAVLAIRKGIAGATWRGIRSSYLTGEEKGGVGPDAVKRKNKLLRAVKALRIDQGNKSYLAIPIDSSLAQVEKFTGQLPHIFRLKQPKLRAAIDLEILAPNDAKRIREFTDATRFKIWLFPRADKIERELMS